ncbi:MAG TPA: hypothetical protein VKJ00_12205 [Thermoanaerobaculia bacterium]|nr:hypothetical protein [Thermoanaerobaculia bacterium]
MKRLVCRLAASGLAFWLVASAPPASAADEATFYLERIEVDNAPPAIGAIVLSQSLLKEGSRYSETELRDALSRVRRLPLVRDAEFALHKGSSRGAYRLSISVERMSPFFLQGSSNLSLFNETVRLRETGRSLFDNSAAVGLRDSVGRQGMLFAGIGTTGSAYGELGYTQYGLFGTGGYAAADLQYSASGNVLVLPFLADPSLSGWEVGESFAARLAVGVPIRRNDSIRARYAHIQADARTVAPVFGFQPDTPAAITKGRLSIDQADLDWLYDTTDDALLPTQGLFLSAGPGTLKANTPESFPTVSPPPGQGPGPPPGPAAAQTTNTAYISLSATRYLPVTDRQTLLGSLQGYAGRTRVDQQPRATTFGLVGTLGHSMSLLSSSSSRDIDDLRLETFLEYTYDRGPPLPAPSYTRFERLRVGTGVVFRSRWALLRLGLSYAVFERGMQ